MSARRLFPILAAAALLPLVRFGQTLWSDEAASVWLARLPLNTLFLSLCDPHPAGYYLGLRLWLWGGESEPWLRLPSLLAGICSALLVYGLGRDMSAGGYTGEAGGYTGEAGGYTGEAGGYTGGRTAQGMAWLAALLLVLHPLQVWYAGEVRMYMVSQALGLLSVWLGWRWLNRASQGMHVGWYALAYWLATVAAFGADYTALVPFFLTQALWLARGRPRPWQWFGLQAVVLLAAGALWLRPSQIFALGRTYPATFLAIVLQPSGLGLTPASIGAILRLTAVMSALGLLATGWQWPRVRRVCDYPGFRWLVAAAWVALILFAAFPRLYSLKRQLVVSLPFLALALSWTLQSTAPNAATPNAATPNAATPNTDRFRWLKVFLVAVSLAVSLLLLPQHRREPWNALIAGLQAQVQAGASLWVDELAWTGFDYYARRLQASHLSQLARPFPDTEQRDIQNEGESAGGDVWLVLYNDAYRDLRSLLPLTFQTAYELAGSQQLDGLSVYHYAPRAPVRAPERAGTPGAIGESGGDGDDTVSQPPPKDWGLDLLSPLSTCRNVGRNAR